jgi:hypothetical protein
MKAQFYGRISGFCLRYAHAFFNVGGKLVFGKKTLSDARKIVGGK